MPPMHRPFRDLFENYLHANGWRKVQTDKGPMWQHKSLPRNHFEDVGSAVVDTPATQSSFNLPIKHVLVTNQPALLN